MSDRDHQPYKVSLPVWHHSEFKIGGSNRSSRIVHQVQDVLIQLPWLKPGLLCGRQLNTTLRIFWPTVKVSDHIVKQSNKFSVYIVWLWHNKNVLVCNGYTYTFILGCREKLSQLIGQISCTLHMINKVMAAFRGMHVSPVKQSYAWLPRKCDYQTDTQSPDKVIPMCRYASQATQKIVAAFWGMHVSSAKQSYDWLPRKCDNRTDRHRETDRRRTKWSLCAAMLRRQHKNMKPDKVITMCRYALQPTQNYKG